MTVPKRNESHSVVGRHLKCSHHLHDKGKKTKQNIRSISGIFCGGDEHVYNLGHVKNVKSSHTFSLAKPNQKMLSWR